MSRQTCSFNLALDGSFFFFNVSFPRITYAARRDSSKQYYAVFKWVFARRIPLTLTEDWKNKIQPTWLEKSAVMLKSILAPCTAKIPHKHLKNGQTVLIIGRCKGRLSAQ